MHLLEMLTQDVQYWLELLVERLVCLAKRHQLMGGQVLLAVVLQQAMLPSHQLEYTKKVVSQGIF